MDASTLLPFRRAVSEHNLGVENVHVDVRGHGAVEFHARADERRDVHSVGKTVVALAIGIARDEGLLDLDDTVLGLLPEFAAGATPGAESITVRHLLTMTAGNDFRWDDDELDGDPVAAFVSAPLLDRPGTTFRYRGTCTYVLGRLLHRVSGTDLLDYLGPRLLTPLGIAAPHWRRCGLGFPLGADGLFLRAAEVGRIATVLRDAGTFAGRPIVTAEFVARMHHDRVVPTEHYRNDPESLVGYGYQYWQCTRPETWRMDGLYGQFGIVAADLGATIAITGHYEGSTGDILRAVWSDLVPALPTAA